MTLSLLTFSSSVSAGFPLQLLAEAQREPSASGPPLQSEKPSEVHSLDRVWLCTSAAVDP